MSSGAAIGPVADGIAPASASVRPGGIPSYAASMTHAIHAFGITAARRPDAALLGRELERLGYAELWANDTRRGDGLVTLADSAAHADRLRLGVGVIALSDQAPERIADRVASAEIPPERLTLGVGSGASASLTLVREAVDELRRRLPGHAIGVAAVGPRMAQLAGETADAVIANWALPDRLRFVRERVAEGAAAAGRPTPRLVAYVRTAIGPGADERLGVEMARYSRFGAHYARAFEAQPDTLVGVAVESGEADAVAAALAPYRAEVDTVVVRGLPAGDTVDEWLAVARAASPLSVAW
jgi:alkanesulfonate monooxygenase SsuD/methylene tetrahydromethanopterin reductase-like flavin-dependent oxidoreductase (luciferase family)